MPEWLLAITDLDESNTRTFLEGNDLKLTRRLNGGNTLTFNAESRDERFEEISIGNRGVKAYRDNELRFHGRVWEPMTWRATQINVECQDPWAHVENRRVAAGTVYQNTLAEDIAWALIEDVAVDDAFGTVVRIQRGPNDMSVSRDRTYETGKPVGEAVRELAGVINGFYFRIDPVDDVPGIQAEFVTLYPESGTDHPEVRFEYGEGTLANLDDYEMRQMLPRNQIRARGAEGLTTVAQDAASIQEFDLIEDEVSFTTVELLATLEQHAENELQPDPLEIFSLTPGLEAPALWDDFDVGDTVRFRLVNGALTRAGSALVTEATVSVSDGGSEQLQQIVIQLLE